MQISKDTVLYFKSRGMKPNDPGSSKQVFSAWGNPSGDSPLSDPLEEEAMNENWKNSILDATSYCPTCGSNASALGGLNKT